MFNNPAIHSPQGITEGPDGNMWFVNPTPGTVGRITPCGKVTIFTGPGIYQPYDIITGPDGALWFTNPGNGSIGRITTAGVVSNFGGHGIARPFGIAAGPDGALWFTGASRIGRITPGGAISIYYTQSSAYPLGGSAGMARGSDGAMWFANSTVDSIGRITTSVTPEITGFAPHSGGPGTRVTIWGRSITRAVRAAFNGVPARIIAQRYNRIIVRAPGGNTAGLVTVTTRAGTAASAAPFG
jgi:streptogramin lyase